MDHWLAIVGACAALAGTLVLGVDLKISKDDAADEAGFRTDLDKITSDVGKNIVALRGALIALGNFVTGYLKLLALDLGPVLEPLLDDGGNRGLGESVAERRRALGLNEQGLRDFEASLDSERALALIREAQRRVEQRYARQGAKVRRMRIVATSGVFLVALGAVAQLLDSLLHS